MKKLLGILVLGLLVWSNSLAENIKSLGNINYEIPEEYLFINKENAEELSKSAKDKDQKEAINAFGDFAKKTDGEFVFNKDLFLNWKKYNFQFDNINVGWGPSNLTELKDVEKNEQAICMVKHDVLKRLNGADKIKSHKCRLSEYPKGAAWSVYQFHENHNNSNIYVYSVTFKIKENSKIVHSVILGCGKHCEKYLPVFDSLVKSITFD